MFVQLKNVANSIKRSSTNKNFAQLYFTIQDEGVYILISAHSDFRCTK